MNGILCAYRRADHPEHAERGGDGVAAALDGQLDEVLRVEVGRVLGEGGRRRVLDALVDRQDRQVAGAAEAAVVEQRAQVAQHRDRSVRPAQTRSMKSGPGRIRSSRGMPLH